MAMQKFLTNALFLILWLGTLSVSPLIAGTVIVPVKAVASSNSTDVQGETIGFHVDKLVLGAKFYNQQTGSNVPYGLMGFPGVVRACIQSDFAASFSATSHPLHDGYDTNSVDHPKHQGMWLSARGDGQAAWLEFELPEVSRLDQLWIWNWADGPEIGRRVKRLTVQTSTQTIDSGQLGHVRFDVTHDTIDFPNVGHVPQRSPDVVYKFSAETQSRYLRLHNISAFGQESSSEAGLAEVFILSVSEDTADGASETSAKDPRTVRAEPDWQLFLDNHMIERSTGFRRVLHHPKPQGVVLKPDQPWEKYIGGPLYVGRRQDDRLECYYRADGAPVKEPIGYAISNDGIHWEKPELNLVDMGGSTKNNLVPCSPPTDLGRFGNVSDPTKRFVMAMGDAGQWRLRLMFSQDPPDFLNDPDWKSKLVEGGMKPSYKLSLHFWDDQHDDWVFMRQTPNHPPTRSVSRWSTRDLKDWTILPVLYPDAEDSTDPRYFDEVYGFHAIHTEGLILGYGSWFMGDHTRPDMARFEQELIGRLHMKGPMDMRVLVSRDGGFTWDRTVSRQAWIPHGSEHDSYDRCVILYTAPVRMGDEDWFYCNVMNGDHGAPYHDRKLKMECALYTQKHNRYVSLNAHDEPQILITKPIEVTGETLQLNVDASRGEVAVGISLEKELHIPNYPPGILPNYVVRDRQGRSHLEPGFGLKECQPVREDCIEYNVRWSNAELKSLLGKTVRLYIRVQNADLYGFRFK